MFILPFHNDKLVYVFRVNKHYRYSKTFGNTTAFTRVSITNLAVEVVLNAAVPLYSSYNVDYKIVVYNSQALLV